MPMTRMLRGGCPLVLFMILSALTVSAKAAEPRTQGWGNDLSRALADGKRLRRPIVLHFYADWCGPCRQMERDVLHTKTLLAEIERKFIAVKINSDQHPELVARYSIRALPSDVFLDPDGRLLSQAEGYQEQNNYLTRLARIDSQVARLQKIRIARRQDIGNASSPDRRGRSSVGRTDSTSTAANGKPAGSTPGTHHTGQSVPVGLDGYSPVALSLHRRWVKGRPEFTATYQQVEYQLASIDELHAFEKDPSRYAPRLLGCDPVILWQTDRAVSGQIQYGAFFDGELYLFASEESRDRFKLEPSQFTQYRHVLRIDEADSSRLR